MNISPKNSEKVSEERRLRDLTYLRRELEHEEGHRSQVVKA